MSDDYDQIQALVDRPGESLTVEIKQWVSPKEPEGIAKLVKSAIALRNHDGGFMVIGFTDSPIEPDTNHAPSDVKTAFHVDTIQHLVTQYASEAFEVTIHFPTRDGQDYVVIAVPSGVTTPVSSKSELKNGAGKLLVKSNTVYVRTLTANSTPSTSEASWKDWPKLMETCFENREADIGRFFRRHLQSITPAVMRQIVSVAQESLSPAPTLEKRLHERLESGHQAFEEAKAKRGLVLPPHGAWQVALLLDGDVPPMHRPNREFLRLLGSSNPDLTGWPIWLDSSGFSKSEDRPYPNEGHWEVLLAAGEGSPFNFLDFMQFDPKGQFYLYRAYQDDLSQTVRPQTYLDFGLQILRTVEAIAVGIAFAKAMGCPTDTTMLSFGFRWTNLRNRELTSWVDLRRSLRPGRKAYQDELTSSVTAPVEAPPSAFFEYAFQALTPLFEVFDGCEISKGVCEELAKQLLERRFRL